MASIFCTANYAKKVLDMKDAGQASKIQNLVIIGVDSIEDSLKTKAEGHGTTLRTFADVIKVGTANSSSPRTKP